MSRNQRSAGKSGGKPDRSAIPRRGEMQPRGRDHVRTAIAHAAAKLIAEGLTDYKAAKQKAARQLGVNESQMLPDNHEIEAALRDHFSLFSPQSQHVALAELRLVAIRLMERLDRFVPWLVGPVLSGTANEFSEIEIELIGVEAKEFELYLLNEGVDYSLSDSCSAHKSPLQGAHTCYCVEFGEHPARITLYSNHAARQTAHPRDSIKRDRADRQEAVRRFSIRDNER